MSDGRVRSGKATSESMTAEQRTARAKAGAAKRAELAALPKASHRGEIKIGDVEIPCAVLTDGTRVISELGVNATLGSSGGKNYKLREKHTHESDSGPLPLFISSKALQPFIYEAFEEKDLMPIEYVDGDKVNRGYSAIILPRVCEVWLRAKDAGALQSSQLPKAKKAEILMRGLAHIGIVALVDEATGYQAAREKDALAKILEAFVAKELRPWIKTFPNSYYEEIFRLYKLPYPPASNRNWKPGFIGTLTNNVVYERLAPEILPELKKAASKAEKKAKLHQWLTDDIGHPKLREHLASIVTLLKLSDTPQDFKNKVDRIHPAFGQTYAMDFDKSET